MSGRASLIPDGVDLVQRAVNTWRVVNRSSHTRHATTRQTGGAIAVRST
jgi:hypothetical protein